MGSSSELVALPVINFSGLDSNSPGDERWNTVRAQVMKALYAYSAFEAVYDKVTPEVWDGFFGQPLKDLFDLPLEAKMRNVSKKHLHGYVGPSLLPHAAYEALNIEGVLQDEGLERFTKLMWPDGNSTFCDAVHNMANPLAELDRMTRRMVLESLEISKYMDSLMESTRNGFRMTKYEPPHSGEKMGMQMHTDLNMVTIICQNQIPGLQVLCEDNGWAVPSLNSITVMTGDAFQAWTNGRVEACHHRVALSGTKERYIALYAASPKDECLVQAPQELVDEEHPLQFKPFLYKDYARFFSSPEGRKAGAIRGSVLKAYCGTEENKEEA